MNISAFSPASIWNNVTRTLSSFGTGAVQYLTIARQSVAGAATVDFRDGVGVGSTHTIAVTTGGTATAAMQIFLWDGTNQILCVATAAAANSPAAFSGISNNVSGLRVVNADAVNGGFYIATGIFFTA